MSQLRLSFSALVITGMLFTVACGPQPEDTPAESSTSSAQHLEDAEKKKKCDYKDPTRRYVARDPNECAAVTYICFEGEQGFFDECGCGCETIP